jgi:hypothetical protein
MKTYSALLGIAAAVYFANVQSSNGSTINVSASSLWTDTSINLELGTTVTITASGSWSWAYGATCGPTGDPTDTTPDLSDDFYSGALKGALLAYIGADPTQSHFGDASFWPQASGYWLVGNSLQFTSLYSGELWLGMNDDAGSKNTYDNSGSLTVEVTTVPEPGSLALATLGVVIACGGAFWRRLR